MKEDFDHIAVNYDIDFTFSEIGKRLRQSVYKHLKTLLSSQKILELNCGTGQDAIWLAKNNDIVATDISLEMLKVAKQKNTGTHCKKLIFEQLDIKKIDTHKFNDKFDLIFSNFGGLNCLNPLELKSFFNSVKPLLTQKGKLILIIMPTFCLWESVYFLFKGKWRSIFRRNTTKKVLTNVKGKSIDTWYYSPINIQKMSADFFKVNTIIPIGFFIPPSYLNNFFKNHLNFLTTLDSIEAKCNRFSFLANFSDHFLIELQVL